MVKVNNFLKKILDKFEKRYIIKQINLLPEIIGMKMRANTINENSRREKHFLIVISYVFRENEKRKPTRKEVQC